MSTWLIWLIISVACLIIEMLNAGFGIICFGIGALLSALMAACGLGILWQLVALTVGSFLSFLFIRPIMIKWLDGKKMEKTNLDTIIGRQATVVDTITTHGGRVAIDGTDWKAQSITDTDIPAGTQVTIIDRQGNTLQVQ